MDEMNPSSMENTWWFYQQGSDGAGRDHAHAQEATEEIAAETDLGLDELKVEEEKPPPASPRELKKLYHNPVANENEAKQSAMFPPFLLRPFDHDTIVRDASECQLPDPHGYTISFSSEPSSCLDLLS